MAPISCSNSKIACGGLQQCPSPQGAFHVFNQISVAGGQSDCSDIHEDILEEDNKKKRLDMRHCCCSMCDKSLEKKFKRTSENPLACWECMIVNVKT